VTFGISFKRKTNVIVSWKDFLLRIHLILTTVDIKQQRLQQRRRSAAHLGRRQQLHAL
jgi:hypothetical protein